jgi:hypothetical protein
LRNAVCGLLVSGVLFFLTAATVHAAPSTSSLDSSATCTQSRPAVLTLETNISGCGFWRINGRPARSDFSASSLHLHQQCPSDPAKPQAVPASDGHPFWDHKNGWLFAAVAASRALDYSSTLNFRRRGVNEALLSNDIVDHHAAFAAIEAGGAAVSILASYLFHRYHHHRLERWTSIVHASVATGGAIRNYCLKTAHH